MKKYVIGAVIVIVRRHSHQDKTPVAVTPSGSYVALGDSVAAGVGLKTDSDSSACDRTNQAYPNLVASALNYKLANLACSGATLPAGVLGQQDVNQLKAKPQLDQLFARTKPSLITMTIGANDAGWTAVFAKCYTGTCGTADDTAGVKQRLAVMGANLQKALAQIQQHYGSNMPQIVVTGYHQVFPASLPAAGCTDLTGIDANELAWGRQQQAAINDTVQNAVKSFAVAKYVAVDFSGHELCAADPWVQGLGDKQPYHPTEAGQAAFAKQIEAAAKITK
jgi:lysophospholipase L1-like esterase